MPLPDVRQLDEYAKKGVELFLRQVRLAPEMRQARRLTTRAETRETGAAAKRILFLTPRDWAAHVQYEAVLAHALRLRGASVHFLTCGGGLEICDRANTYEAPPMPCRTCAHYVHAALDAHGLPRSTIREAWEQDDPGAWPLLDEVPRSELSKVSHEGLELGALIDIPLKWFLCAADLEDDPIAGHAARAFLRSSRRIVTGIAAALDRVQPDTVILLNGLFLFESIAWAMCEQRGIDVVTYERAFLKETLVFRRGSPAGFYDFSDEWDRAARPLRDDEEHELEDYLQRRRRGQAFDQFWTFQEVDVQRGEGRLVTLFTNLTWDTAVIGRDLAFPDIRAWITHAIRAFGDRPQHRLVVRIHPSELRLPGKQTRDSLQGVVSAAFPTLPDNVMVIGPDDLTSSYPLMDASDLGLVYTSTTGLELALSGTPVIVAGETHYRGKGFTHDVSSEAEFDAVLDQALLRPEGFRPDVDLARRYAHFFFFRAPVAAPGVIEPLPGLARLTVDSLDELAPGADPALDELCAAILDGSSFLGDESAGPPNGSA